MSTSSAHALHPGARHPSGARRGPAGRLQALLLGLLLILASQAGLAAQDRLSDLEHRRWTVADNGPRQVSALAQTSDGYLWLGTQDSLYRFDGLRFTRYQAPDGQPLGIVSTLYTDEKGLWVGLRKGGVHLITPTTLLTYPAGQGLPEGVVYGLARDRTGALWVAAHDGLARFDGQSWQHVSQDWQFPGHNARAVFVDRAGTLWVASEDRLFYLPKGAQHFQDAGIAVGWINQITQAPDGAIWLVEREGGVLHRLQQMAGIPLAQRHAIAGAKQLLFDRHGALWVSTINQGLLRLQPTSAVGPLDLSSAEAFTTHNGLSADSTRPLLEDREGSIWVGSSAGLDRFRPHRMTVADLPGDARNLALAASADGSLWAGASNRGAVRLDAEGVQNVDIPAPISSAFSDAQGAVWMAGSNGIWRARGQQVEYIAALPTTADLDSAVRAMTLDQQGALWVSINRTGLFVLRDGQWSLHPSPTLAPSQVMPVTASTDPQGRLWFGYRDNLIVTRDASGERQWGEADGLSIGHVTALLHQPNRTWVAGQRGLAYFDGERFHGLRVPDNGLFDNIYALLAAPPAWPQAPGDDLWLQSKAGIFQIAASELERAIANPEHAMRYRSYELQRGLANDPFQVMPLPSAVRSADGRLWFTTSQGVVWIDPAAIEPLGGTPLILIDGLNVDGRNLPIDPPPTLDPESRRIEISYSALSLSAQEDLNFSYRLDGVDSTWHPLDTNRSAVYSGLGPGTYRFRVIASDQAGVSSDQEAQLTFSVQPLFYQKPLFILLCVVALAGVLWALHLLNMRRVAANLRARLEARHEERERIARELHDTLLQGVQGLMLSFQAATQLIDEQHPARIRMERALDRADEVLAEGRDRVKDLRRLNHVEPALIDAFAVLASELEQDGTTAFSLNSEGTALPLHPIVREESYRIGREAMINALRHATASRISVTIAYNRTAFELTIEDDGQGIQLDYLPPYSRPDHWGMCGMLERAEKIGGRLLIHSGVGNGTEIHLSVPAQTAYRSQPGWLQRWLRTLNKPRS
ncbi:MAG: sensor histidine kinase [Pseudomonas sp.]|uniref:sensor histidine kinase n=1 Tax=Pseudomonas sp. TaxID=306 RepID=UPI003D10D373